MNRSPSDIADRLRAPTVAKDGSRRWLYPERRNGTRASRRRALAYLLIFIYLLVPFIKVEGHALLRFGFDTGVISFFGQSYRFSETYLLAFTVISLGFGIAWTTSLFGRVWCGYACPQTVFIDWLIRPIEEFWEGNANARRHRDQAPLQVEGMIRKGMKHLSFLLLILLISHAFLAYFFAPSTLWQWIQLSPSQHPWPFLIMLGTSAALYFNFVWFREQFCSFLCPYARFQSVLIQTSTPTVAFDYKRGEPRGRKAEGACIDCGLCNRVCPTGIDIRQGLQLECIQCMRCADACDTIMSNLKRPKGLIRMASQKELEGGKADLWQAFRERRSLAFFLLALISASMLLYQLVGRQPVKIDLMRQEKSSFTRLEDGSIANYFILRLTNRTQLAQSFSLTAPDGVEIICPPCGQKLEPSEELRSVLIVKLRANQKLRSVDLTIDKTEETLHVPLLLP